MAPGLIFTCAAATASGQLIVYAVHHLKLLPAAHLGQSWLEDMQQFSQVARAPLGERSAPAHRCQAVLEGQGVVQCYLRQGTNTILGQNTYCSVIGAFSVSCLPLTSATLRVSVMPCLAVSPSKLAWRPTKAGKSPSEDGTRESQPLQLQARGYGGTRQ